MAFTETFLPTDFAADAQDLTLSAQTDSLAFQLKKGNETILNETYTYNPEDHTVTITGLADVLSCALWGHLSEGYQPDASAEFTFQATGQDELTKRLYAMRLRNPRDPEGKRWVLTATDSMVCLPGRETLVTLRKGAVVTLIDVKGTAIGDSELRLSMGPVHTFNLNPRALFPERWAEGATMEIWHDGEVGLTIQLIQRPCPHAATVRYLNRYDVPETLHALGGLELKAAVDDSVAIVGGRRTRLSVADATEYTLLSGPLVKGADLVQWQDLSTARRAQLLYEGTWIDIVPTKPDFTRRSAPFYGSQAKLTFRTASASDMLYF